MILIDYLYIYIIAAGSPSAVKNKVQLKSSTPATGSGPNNLEKEYILNLQQQIYFLGKNNNQTYHQLFINNSLSSPL